MFNETVDYSERTVRRVGMLIKLKSDCLEEYKRLHAAAHPGVRDLLLRYHLHNFSIFLQKIGDDYYEFGYYEYRGESFESDMAKLAMEPRNIEWLKVCDTMQVPLEGHSGWTEMEAIYYNG
jgi:L-rhamnose mutarotase